MLSGRIEGRNNYRAFAFQHFVMKGSGQMADPEQLLEGTGK
jgi:hypothetical protein